MNGADSQLIQKPYRSSSYHSKRALLVWLIILAALSPLILGLFYESTLVEYLVVFVMSLIVYFWCRLDAAEAGKKIPWIISLAIICVVGVGFPIYLVRVRRVPVGQAVSILFFWMLLYVGIFYSSAFLMQWVFG